METTIQSPIKFTEGALTEIKRLMSEPGFDTSQTLRIGVKGGGCSGLSYVIGFDSSTDKDHHYEQGGLRYLIEASHELYLYGMEIDWQGGLNSRGFTFSNPNASSTCGCGTSFAV
ncbi:MAG TPA: iron-sulfur cluster assembly accessory protein [Flavisolibacter sp.]|jgi:iron-sulfur cluster assembly protein|nr:iron-sulfur cluster assembly accessory protein [Flavisolibacter sp.]